VLERFSPERQAAHLGALLAARLGVAPASLPRAADA
jgi:hypothetical protein